MACVLQVVRLDSLMVPLLPLKSMNLMKIMCVYQGENMPVYCTKFLCLISQKAQKPDYFLSQDFFLQY